ncbi:MAG: SUMF1/EgtB/PvdO family nonheme iron enzyme [Phycisphaerales bacterium]|nr:SUMF1/EgtB/PvdO family nonheme iron enzyme [Phycisphaerales bacterium]
MILLVLCFFIQETSTTKPTPFTETLKNFDITFTMIPVQTETSVFWIAQTEVSWDLYDTFLNIVNSPENIREGVDAITGPTPAYALVDRGFGRNGYPAISMSVKAAESFCQWLSKTTSRTYQIPTIEQWAAANVGGGTSWHKENAENTTHPLGTSKPNTLGIFDLLGNVGEWVSTQDGPRVVGGSFRTPLEELGEPSILTPTKEWNQTDPQLPRSPWWLADADFVGLRIVTTNGEAHE